MKSQEEEDAFRQLGEVHNLIFNRWKLKRGNNLEMEFCAALHVLQGFIVQHMLQREDPGEWGEWFEEERGYDGQRTP